VGLFKPAGGKKSKDTVVVDGIMYGPNSAIAPLRWMRARDGQSGIPKKSVPQDIGLLGRVINVAWRSWSTNLLWALDCT